jgi:hypothetical protein
MSMGELDSIGSEILAITCILDLISWTYLMLHSSLPHFCPSFHGLVSQLHLLGWRHGLLRLSSMILGITHY